MIIHEMKKHEHLPNSDVYNIIGVLCLSLHFNDHFQVDLG